MAVTHPSLQGFSDFVQGFCADWLNGNVRRIVVIGKSGTGKTRTLLNVVKWAQRVDRLPAPIIVYVKFAQFCDEIVSRDTTFRQALEAACPVQNIRQCGIFCIDDIGSEVDRFRSGQPTLFLQDLLEETQDHCSTLVTTNVPQSAWAERWDERVADRLLRNSTIINLAGVPAWSEVT